MLSKAASGRSGRSRPLMEPAEAGRWLPGHGVSAIDLRTYAKWHFRRMICEPVSAPKATSVVLKQMYPVHCTSSSKRVWIHHRRQRHDRRWLHTLNGVAATATSSEQKDPAHC